MQNPAVYSTTLETQDAGRATRRFHKLQRCILHRSTLQWPGIIFASFSFILTPLLPPNYHWPHYIPTLTKKISLRAISSCLASGSPTATWLHCIQNLTQTLRKRSIYSCAEFCRTVKTTAMSFGTFSPMIIMPALAPETFKQLNQEIALVMH